MLVFETSQNLRNGKKYERTTNSSMSEDNNFETNPITSVQEINITSKFEARFLTHQKLTSRPEKTSLPWLSRQKS